MSKNIAFVPLRGGSKSIPFKNIKNFCGKPLAYWILNSLQCSKSIDKIIVSTDSEEIIQTVEDFRHNKTKLIRRSPRNARDISSTEDVMLEYINNANIADEDVFILVQVTSPFTQYHDFDNALKAYNTGNFDSMLSCVRNKRFLWTKEGTPINYDFQKRPRRQDFEGFFMENGAFYINLVKNIRNHNNRLSGNIGIYEMPGFTYIELDEVYEWHIAEELFRKNVLNNRLHKSHIKAVISDIDGVLTDAGMYYTEGGDEMKKFSTYDGKAFELLIEKGLITGFITSENRLLNQRRAEKLNVSFIYQGIKDKLATAKQICEKYNIILQEVAYIGDDINDLELLKNVGFPICPKNAVDIVKQVPGIQIMQNKGGEGVIREVADNYFI